MDDQLTLGIAFHVANAFLMFGPFIQPLFGSRSRAGVLALVFNGKSFVSVLLMDPGRAVGTPHAGWMLGAPHGFLAGKPFL